MRFELFQSLNEAKLHGHINYEGLDISIEVPAGSYRRGTNKKTGEEWKMLVSASYGYIKGTHSPDGEHLDCYLRKNPKKGAVVYVIHQMTVDGTKFDEDKVMLGYSSQDEAVKAFKKMTFKPSTMYGGVSEFTMDHFKLAAYSASNSKAMLTSEENYDKFKRKGHLPPGIKSPVGVAMRVSEALSLGLGEIGEELTRVEEDPFADNESSNGGPLITYSDYQTLDDAKEFAKHHDIPCEINLEDGMCLQFPDEDKLETFLSAVAYTTNVDFLAGDHQAAIKTPEAAFEAVEEFEEMEIPMDTNESYVVVLHTQIMENLGSAASWGTHSSKVTLIQEGFESYGEARAVAAKIASGEIPVEIAEGVMVMGIEAMPTAEYRQFHETAVEEEEAVQEDTTEDVFFAQQVQEAHTLAGIKPGLFESKGTPSVHETRARLAALTQQFYEELEEEVAENTFPAEKVEEAVRIISETQKANPGVGLDTITKAVCKKVYGNMNLAESLMEQANNRGLIS